MHFQEGMRDRHLELLPAFMDALNAAASPTAWCLDLGTGEGRVAFTLAPLVRWVVGIDIARDRIERARERLRDEGLANVQFLLIDAEQVTYRDLAPTGSFQLIASNLCLSRKIIEKAAEALAPNGKLVCTCFEKRHWRETGVPMSGAFSEESLRGALQENGLQTELFVLARRAVEFDSIAQLRDKYLPPELLASWRSNGRWAGVERSFAASAKTLTMSKIVFAARRAQRRL